MVVNWNERKQDSGSEWDEVLYNTGGLLFVYQSPQALSGLKSALSSLKSTLSGLKSALPGLESVRADLRPERPDFRPERAWGEQTDKQMNEQTKVPCVLQDIVPFAAAAQK